MEQNPKWRSNFSNKIKTVFKDKALRIIIVAIVLILIMPAILSQFSGVFSFMGTGPIGDTIGGITSPIVGTLGAILVYYALREQIKANEIITDQFKEQRKTTVQQNFESTFFNLLSLHQNIVDNMRIEPVRLKDLPMSFPKKGSEVEYLIEQFTEQKSIPNSIEKRDLFKLSSELLTALINNFDTKLVTYEAVHEIIPSDASKFDFPISGFNDIDGEPFNSTFREMYLRMFELLDSHLGHYYRLLYRIIKFIDEHDFLTGNEKEEYDKKYFYTTIVRSQLSDYEIQWLFYNCMYDYGKDFRPLVEEYTLLKILVRNENEPFKKFKGQYAKTAFEEVRWRETSDPSSINREFERVPLSEY